MWTTPCAGALDGSLDRSRFGTRSASNGWRTALEREGKRCRRSSRKCSRRRQKSFYEVAKKEPRAISILPPARARARRRSLPGFIILKSLKERTAVVQENSGASLIDLGDGVLCCEFHSKMNAIGGDIVAMLHAGVARLGTEFEAMVIAQSGAEFFRGRESDAAAHQRAGRRMGRHSSRRPRSFSAPTWPSSMRRGRWWPLRREWRLGAAAKSVCTPRGSMRPRKLIWDLSKPAWA